MTRQIGRKSEKTENYNPAKITHSLSLPHTRTEHNWTQSIKLNQLKSFSDSLSSSLAEESDDDDDGTSFSHFLLFLGGGSALALTWTGLEGRSDLLSPPPPLFSSLAFPRSVAAAAVVVAGALLFSAFSGTGWALRSRSLSLSLGLASRSPARCSRSLATLLSRVSRCSLSLGLSLSSLSARGADWLLAGVATRWRDWRLDSNMEGKQNKWWERNVLIWLRRRL